jgi:hypothetical protein
MGTTQQQITNRNELDALRREIDQLRADLAKRPENALALPFKPHPASYEERVLKEHRMTIHFTAAEARMITALAKGLSEAREKLANGKPVYLPGHAVQWLLEHVELVG